MDHDCKLVQYREPTAESESYIEYYLFCQGLQLISIIYLYWVRQKKGRIELSKVIITKLNNKSANNDNLYLLNKDWMIHTIRYTHFHTASIASKNQNHGTGTGNWGGNFFNGK